MGILFYKTLKKRRLEKRIQYLHTFMINRQLLSMLGIFRVTKRKINVNLEMWGFETLTLILFKF